MGDLGGATKQATGAIDDQAKSLKKLKREASRTLTPLDELHKIEKKMAGADGGIEPIDFDFGFDADSFLPDIDEAFFGPDGLVGAFEELTEHATIKGFFEWLWESWSEWVQSWTWLDPIEDAIIEFFVVTVPNAWQKFKRWISQQWDDFVNSLLKMWNDFTGWLSRCWEGVKTHWSNFWAWVRNKWNELKLGVQNIWNSFVQWLSRCWEGVKTHWNNFWAWVTTKWTGLKTSVQNIWNGIISWLANSWNSVKTAWNNFVQWVKGWSLWKTLQEKIDWVKNLFNFEWKMPKIKLPRYSVTWDKSGFWADVGKFMGLPGKPNLSVRWLAKGGILGNATLIGAGEAGREAVLPLDRNTEWADIVADKLARSLGGKDNETPLIIQVIVGDDMLLEKVIDASERKNARAGRTVVQLGG